LHYHPFLGPEPGPGPGPGPGPVFVDEEELGHVEGQKFVVDEILFNM